MNSLNNLRVGIRLPAVVVISLAGLVVFAAVAKGTISTVRVGGDLHTSLDQDRRLWANFSDPDLTAKEIGARAHDVVLYSVLEDPAKATAAAEALVEQITVFEAAHAEWATELTEPEQIERLATLKRSGDAVVAAAVDAVLPAHEANDIAAITAAKDTIDAVLEPHTADADAMYESTGDDLAEKQAAADDMVASRTRLMWVMLFATVLIAGSLAAIVTRSILKPLGALRENLRSIAEGGADAASVRLDDDRRDEFGEIAESFNAFADHLAASAVASRENARRAEARAAEVEAAATVAAENMNTVAVATTELSAAASEIARSASDASVTATAAVTAAGRANELMGRLAASSAEIGVVVESIRGIAAQTTMLALNATIEAARAGEAGRGFAVVASEVKDLAAETGAATAGIVERVEAIRADTDAALAALTEVTHVIADISASQSVIAASVEEQAATTSEIDRSLTEAVTAVNQLAGTRSAVQTDRAFAAAGSPPDHAGADLVGVG